jgi:hypothetical protein
MGLMGSFELLSAEGFFYLESFIYRMLRLGQVRLYVAQAQATVST